MVERWRPDVVDTASRGFADPPRPIRKVAVMKNRPVPESGVVVGIDDTPGADVALDWAVGEALRLRLPLHVVHLLTWIGPTPFDEAEEVDDTVRVSVERLQGQHPELVVSGHTATGSAARSLVEASRRASLVVLGAHSGPPRPLGSTVTQVATHAFCPVVVARRPSDGPERFDEPHPVVVGVDETPESHPALTFAFEQAASRGLGLVALHTWWWQEAGGYLAGTDWEDHYHAVEEAETSHIGSLLAGIRATYPQVDVVQKLVRGHPVSALVEESKTAELVVVGSRGRGGFVGLLLGSVSQRLLARAHGPVAVVRAPATSSSPAGTAP